MGGLILQHQRPYHAVIIRGGTSKGVYIEKNLLPEDPQKCEQVILRLMGSPDRRQIDGIGGADTLTSKICLMAPPTRTDADIDYTFGQVGIDTPHVSFESNCGNLSPGAAIYAIQKGYVKPMEPVTTVRIHNTNLDRILIAKVSVKDGEPEVDGDFSIDGVPGTGSEVEMDYSETAGGTTGKLLPLGSPSVMLHLDCLNKEIPVSVVDIGNLCVFVNAEDVGLSGTELPGSTYDNRPFGELQSKIAAMLGLQTSYVLPMPICVSSPQDYKTFTGGQVVTSDCDLVVRLIRGQCALYPNGTMQKAFPGTASVCTAIAALLPGTVVHRVARLGAGTGTVRLGHPSGVIAVTAEAEQTDTGFQVKRVLFSRTCRTIMEGDIYIPERFYKDLKT